MNPIFTRGEFCVLVQGVKWISQTNLSMFTFAAFIFLYILQTYEKFSCALLLDTQTNKPDKVECLSPSNFNVRTEKRPSNIQAVSWHCGKIRRRLTPMKTFLRGDFFWQFKLY